MESAGIKPWQIAEGKAMREWNDWYNSEAGREQREKDEAQVRVWKLRDEEEQRQKVAYFEKFLEDSNLHAIYDLATSNSNSLCFEIAEMIRRASNLSFEQNKTKDSVRSILMKNKEIRPEDVCGTRWIQD